MYPLLILNPLVDSSSRRRGWSLVDGVEKGFVTLWHRILHWTWRVSGKDQRTPLCAMLPWPKMKLVCECHVTIYCAIETIVIDKTPGHKGLKILINLPAIHFIAISLQKRRSLLTVNHLQEEGNIRCYLPLLYNTKWDNLFPFQFILKSLLFSLGVTEWSLIKV